MCQCIGCSDDLPVCQSGLCQCTGCSDDLPVCQSGLCQCIGCSDDLPVCQSGLHLYMHVDMCQTVSVCKSVTGKSSNIINSAAS